MGDDRWRGPGGVFWASRRAFRAPLEGRRGSLSLLLGVRLGAPLVQPLRGGRKPSPLNPPAAGLSRPVAPHPRGGAGRDRRAQRLRFPRPRPPDLSRIRGQEGRRPEAVTGRFSPGAVLVLGGREGKPVRPMRNGVPLRSSARRGLVPSPRRNLEAALGGSAFLCLGFPVFVLRGVDF